MILSKSFKFGWRIDAEVYKDRIQSFCVRDQDSCIWAQSVRHSASANAFLCLTLTVWETVTVTFMTTETLLNMHAQAFILIRLCAECTYVLCALLKHIHQPCWDSPVTNNRSVKCEVCFCLISGLSVCEVAVNDESRWHADIARRSRWTPASRLSPNYRLLLTVSPSFSTSQWLRSASNSRWKMSCKIESVS